MNGIILKTNTKTNLNIDEVTQGALGLTSDTNELVINELGELKYRNVKIEGTTAVSKNSGTPSGGDIGDLVLDTNIGQHKEYYKFNSWQVRNEGYSQTYLEANFEPKVNFPTPDEYVRLDGTVLMDENYDHSTPDSIITKSFIDLLASADLSQVIKLDGSRQMNAEYNPTLGGDVIDKKFLTSGEMLIIPPTSDPLIAGVIWNNAGTLAISLG